MAIVVLVLLLALGGSVYQHVATARGPRPLRGQLVAVGDHQLYIECLGVPQAGSPTVILEAGLGGTSSAWGWILPAIAKTTRVCAYDRAGMGWSEPGPEPRDANHIVEELHTLLANAEVSGPYVLTGWSFGGLYMRVFADRYAAEVAGMVLLDSSFPDQCTSTVEGVAQCRKIRAIYRVAPSLAAIGVMRIIGHLQPPSGLPEPQNSEVLASFSAAKDWRTQSAEYRAAPAMNEQARAAVMPKDIPLFVVTATEHDTSPARDQLWQEWQHQMTALSANSVQRVVEGASHSSLLFDAKDAQASIDAILRVVEAARSGKRLADTR